MPSTGRKGDSGPSLAVMQVVVGVIRGADGRILTARRQAGKPGAGEWEFPGGKVEAGETPAEALARELAEEVGIRVTAFRPLICVRYAFPDRVVVLDTYEVYAYRGEPHGREGQQLAWQAREALSCPPILASSVAIVNAIKLPERYLFTGEGAEHPDRYLEQLQVALRAGVRLVRLRCPELSDEAYRCLAQRALVHTRKAGARLMLDRSPELVTALGADGLHLTGDCLSELKQRPLEPGFWLAASCHCAEDLSHAASIGCDFAVLSPVAPTGSHPGAEPMGWNTFAERVREAVLPVYALGGMGPADVETARRHGGQGIAAITGLGWEKG